MAASSSADLGFEGRQAGQGGPVPKGHRGGVAQNSEQGGRVAFRHGTQGQAFGFQNHGLNMPGLTQRSGLV